MQLLPDLLEGIVNSLLQTLTKAFGTVTSQLDCPQLMNIDTSQFNNYPGYTKSL